MNKPVFFHKKLCINIFKSQVLFATASFWVSRTLSLLWCIQTIKNFRLSLILQMRLIPNLYSTLLKWRSFFGDDYQTWSLFLCCKDLEPSFFDFECLLWKSDETNARGFNQMPSQIFQRANKSTSSTYPWTL